MLKNSKKTYILVFMVAVILIGIRYSNYLTLETYQQYRIQLNQYTSENKVLSSLFFALIYILVTASSLPGAAVLTLVGGALFGLFWGTILVSISSTIGATFAFLLSRYLFQDFFRQRFGNYLSKIDQEIKEKGSSYLFTIRLLPLFPFFVVNALMGLTQIAIVKYFIVSLLGMLPGTIVYVWAGSELGQVTTIKGLFGPGLILAFVTLATFPYLVSGLMRKYKNFQVYRPYVKPKEFDYNLVVIGAGAAGLVSTAIARAVKARVAIVENHRMGGDCLNFGCVPSKALIHASQIHGASFQQAMQHVQESIKAIEPHDSVARFKSLGADVIQGSAQIISPWEVQVGDQILTTRSIIIATGASPNIPQIEGLQLVTPLTSDTVWDLKALPEDLLIVGGGAIGCELAQAFARLGTQVTLIEKGSQLLSHENLVAAEVILESLKKDRIEVLLNTSLLRFESKNTCQLSGPNEKLMNKTFTAVLFAIGRKPRVQGFGLEKLGVEINKNGTILHNEFMQTKFPNIYVCGDVAGPMPLTHVAGHQAWYASVNALFSSVKKFKQDLSVIPRCTFTSPEVASVGESESQLDSRQIKYEVIHYPFDTFDRAVCDQANQGFVRILVAKGSDRILGATIVAPRAGEMIMEFTLAMRCRLGLKKILGTVHPYPSWSDANKMAALAWQKKHTPHELLKWVERFHDWKRS